MVKSDSELVETSGVTLETLRHQATEILTQLIPQPDSPKPKNTGKKAKKRKASESDRTLSHSLFATYRQSEDNLTTSAIAYLLKNGCELTDKEEGPEKFAKRRRLVEIQIQRLTEQLTARMPKGRDLTNAQWLETLAIASNTVPENEAQAKYCTVDTPLWTAEGTEQVKEEKAAEIAKVLTKTKDKGNLNENQQAFIQRKSSTLTRINNPFPRPSKPLYQGKSHILVGVSLGLEKPATIAVVDAIASKPLNYRSVKQLLGKNYHLLNRQRQEKQRTSQQRYNAQKQADPNRFGESELGEYVDRLLAKEIIAIAQKYQASSIVLPKLGDMREIVQSETQALAEEKCPEFLEGQRNYAKQSRVSVHNWSYGRLIECIKSQAAKVGMAIEEGQQPVRGSPQEKAKEIAISVYHSRSKT